VSSLTATLTGRLAMFLDICSESGSAILVHTTSERLEKEVLPRAYNHENVNNLKSACISLSVVSRGKVR